MQPKQPVILVVDDEESLRRLVGRALFRLGVKLLQAEDAAVALERLDEVHGAVDLVITDLAMPGWHGMDLGAELSRRYPEIPVLYMSGNVQSIAMRVLAEGSPDAVLGKPFTTRMLMEKVNRLLEGRPPRT